MKPVAAINLVFLASILTLIPGAAQNVDRVALQTLVDAENAFAKASEEKGTRESFLMFIAEDGILFRPTAVIGKKWMLENPLPPAPKRSLLSWRPEFADIARAGDMGYTFGPWEFKGDINDEKPAAYGHFITVWKKQADGSWKFAVDLGVAHSQPKDAIPLWRLPANYRQETWRPTRLDLESARAALLSRDREFSKVSAAEGAAKAFLTYTAADARLFRNEHYPFAGKDAIQQALSTPTLANNVLTWEPSAVDVSRSGDLGYTHGTYTLSSRNEPVKISQRGNYLRIWKKHEGSWKVVADVADPLPLEEKKN